MQWWGWTLCWILIFTLATVYVGWRLWRLWPRLRALGVELASAQALLDELDNESEVRRTPTMRSIDDLAVLRSPVALNEERRKLKQTQRDARTARQVARTRQWMHDVE